MPKPSSHMACTLDAVASSRDGRQPPTVIALSAGRRNDPLDANYTQSQVSRVSAKVRRVPREAGGGVYAACCCTSLLYCKRPESQQPGCHTCEARRLRSCDPSLTETQLGGFPPPPVVVFTPDLLAVACDTAGGTIGVAAELSRLVPLPGVGQGIAGRPRCVSHLRRRYVTVIVAASVRGRRNRSGTVVAGVCGGRSRGSAERRRRHCRGGSW
jgi:hypothetical protein